MNIYEMATKYDEQQRGLPYPQKPQKPAEKDYKSHTDYGAALDLWEEDKKQWMKRVEEYRETCGNIYEKFKDELLTMLEIKDNPKAEKLWSMAWENGHSNGYYSVAQEAEELAELLT